MPLTLNGTTGIAGVDGSASTPAAQGSDTNTGVFYPATYTVGLATNGTERARVSSDGTFRVKGAGTAGSTDALQISGSAPASTLALNSDGQTVLGAGTASLPAMSTTGDLNTGTFYPAADTIGWTTGGSERARIDSSGNLLIGTTSTNYSGLISATKSATGTIFGFYTPGTGGTSGYILRGGDDSNQTINIFSNGNIANKNNSYGQISDISLKENVVDATGKLSELLQLKIRNFNFIADTEKKKQIGVVAQELEQVFPSLIDIDGDGIKSVKYSVLLPIAIKAIQELNAKLEAAEARIAALEAK